MADSDFVFEEGTAIRVGSHGDHDYVFAAGQEVTDSGKSSVVFESGTGIGGADVIDDFNDGDMKEYQDTDTVSLVSSPVWEGAFALRCEGGTGTRTKPVSLSGDGLDRYPVRGDPTFRAYTYLPSGLGPQEELKWGVIWAAQEYSSTTSYNSTGGYELECRYDTSAVFGSGSDIYLTRDTEDGDVDRVTDDVNWGNYEDEWLYLDIDFDSGGNAVSLHRAADDSEIASVSHGNTDVDFGGVGYFIGSVDGPIMDFYHFP